MSTYERDGKHYFHDEIGDEHGPYRTKLKAEKNLKSYCYWLDNGPTWWQSFWWPVKRWIKQ